MIFFALSVLVTLLFSLLKTQALWEFRNIECIPFDKPFASFDYCTLKSVNRTYKYMSLRVKLHNVPISNITVGVAIYKKASGYKPFLYNITFDGCKALTNQVNPLVRYFRGFIIGYTNLNHTCPIDHDVIVEKLPISRLNDMLGNVLPFPHGEYLANTIWSAYNVPRANVKAYIAFV